MSISRTLRLLLLVSVVSLFAQSGEEGVEYVQQDEELNQPVVRSKSGFGRQGCIELGGSVNYSVIIPPAEFSGSSIYNLTIAPTLNFFISKGIFIAPALQVSNTWYDDVSVLQTMLGINFGAMATQTKSIVKPFVDCGPGIIIISGSIEDSLYNYNASDSRTFIKFEAGLKIEPLPHFIVTLAPTYTVYSKNDENVGYSVFNFLVGISAAIY